MNMGKTTAWYQKAALPPQALPPLAPPHAGGKGGYRFPFPAITLTTGYNDEEPGHLMAR